MYCLRKLRSISEILVIGVLLLFLFGCVSAGTPSSSSAATKKMEELKEKYKTLDLAKNEIHVEEVVPAGTDPYMFDSFAMANATLSFLSSFELQHSMSVENQYALLKNLFTNIPSEYKDKWIRDILIGEFFPDGSDLIISLHISPVNPSAEINADSLVFLLTNSLNFKIQEKGSSESEYAHSDYPINTNINSSSLFVMFPEGLLVTGNNLNKEDIQPKDSDDALTRINLADTYIKDPIKSNDVQVPSLLEPIIQDTANDKTLRTAAKLNLFLHSLYTHDLTKAEEQLKDLFTIDTSDLDKSFEDVIKIEALNLFCLVKTLDTGDESFLSFTL